MQKMEASLVVLASLLYVASAAVLPFHARGNVCVCVCMHVCVCVCVLCVLWSYAVVYLSVSMHVYVSIPPSLNLLCLVQFVWIKNMIKSATCAITWVMCVCVPFVCGCACCVCGKCAHVTLSPCFRVLCSVSLHLGLCFLRLFCVRSCVCAYVQE